jgi:hypothetical protein
MRQLANASPVPRAGAQAPQNQTAIAGETPGAGPIVSLETDCCLCVTIESLTDNNPPKSSYELALERFRKRDEEAGVERRPLTEAQKASVAEVRTFYLAKIAELEVLHQGRMRSTADPADRATLEDDYRRDRARLVSERDAKVEKARGS